MPTPGLDKIQIACALLLAIGQMDAGEFCSEPLIGCSAAASVTPAIAGWPIVAGPLAPCGATQLGLLRPFSLAQPHTASRLVM